MAEQTLTVYLGDIADAIREVDGTEAEIPAPDFPERIKGIPLAIAVSKLDEAIQRANAAKADVETSDDGGEGLPNLTKYVTSAEMATFETAIQAAETVKSEATEPTQAYDAIPALEDAIAVFERQVKYVFTPPEDIADASWQEIELLSALAAESPQDYMKYLGQTKVIDMSAFGSSVGDVTVMVIGVGHDKGPNGETRGLTFQLRDGLDYSGFNMNSSSMTEGGWRDSRMRTVNLPRLRDAMPEDLRSRLKVMVKKTYITPDFNELIETEDDLALLSQVEVWGEKRVSGWAVPTGEGEQYEWYVEHNTATDRIITDADGSANQWWMRSVHSATMFRRVSSSGDLDDRGAFVTSLPCACFSV